MKILVTGGAGFIGSHTAVELIDKGHEVIIFDNLSNSSEKVIDRIRQITGKTPIFVKADMLDKAAMNDVMSYKPDCVIHFAGLKAVGESVKKPWLYYNNNITGTLNLLRAMEDHGIRNSARNTHYGKVPQRDLHQPVRVDQIDDRTDPVRRL